MSNNITREEISEYINSEFGLSKSDCNILVSEIIEQIILGLISDNIVKIHNFGTFKLKQKRQRIGRNYFKKGNCKMKTICVLRKQI